MLGRGKVKSVCTLNFVYVLITVFRFYFKILLCPCVCVHVCERILKKVSSRVTRDVA